MPQINFNPSMMINQNYADPGFNNYMSTNPNMFQTQRNAPNNRNKPRSSRYMGNFTKEGSGNMDSAMGHFGMGGMNHTKTSEVNRYNAEYFQEGSNPNSNSNNNSNKIKKKTSNLRKNKSPVRKTNRSSKYCILTCDQLIYIDMS